MVHDYSDHQEEASPDVLARVQRAGAEMLVAQQEVERLTTELEEAKSTLKEFEEKTIPQLLEDVGLQSVTLEGGVVIGVDEQTFGSIVAGKEAEAHKWMSENGHDALIKRTFTIKFGKGDDKWANKFERDLAQRKKPLPCERKEAVHAQTLRKFIRDQTAAGTALPDSFSVFNRRVASITLPD